MARLVAAPLSFGTEGRMARERTVQKQFQDQYGQRGKSLPSSVQRLRVWVGSDPSRRPELADALVHLTGHRLLGHGYAGRRRSGGRMAGRAAADRERTHGALRLGPRRGPLGQRARPSGHDPGWGGAAGRREELRDQYTLNDEVASFLQRSSGGVGVGQAKGQLWAFLARASSRAACTSLRVVSLLAFW